MYSEVERLTRVLCAPHGTPGCEEEAIAAAAKELSFCDEVITNPLGGAVGILGKRDAKRRILLDAHIDQIGLIVTFIDEDGFIEEYEIADVNVKNNTEGDMGIAKQIIKQVNNRFFLCNIIYSFSVH